MPWPTNAKPVSGAGPGEQIQPPDTEVVNPSTGSMLKTAGKAGLQTLSGIGGAALGTAANIGHLAVPDALVEKLEGPQAVERANETEEKLQPHTPFESLGSGLGKVAQFMIPGEAEEAAASLAPAGVLRGLTRIGAGGLSSGLVNKAQGGDFSAGAETGGALGALGEGARVLSPQLMRTALPGTNTDTARAVLNETSAIRPSTLERQVGERIGGLGNDLTDVIKAASQRATPPVRGFLMPPREEIPLAPAPRPANPKMRPMSFRAQVKPEELFSPRSGNPMAPISEYPISNPHYLSGSEHPELAGRVTPLQNPQQVTTRMGVLLRRPEMSASTPPANEPNAIVSMRPARVPVASAIGAARSQEAGGLHEELGNLNDFLHVGRVTGEPIPETITPQRALGIRRGLNEEFIGNRAWQRDVNPRATQAAKSAYGGLTGELHEKVPGSVDLDERIHNLIPAQTALKGINRREPSIVGNVSGRIGARTGALTAAAMGAAGGARDAGLPGAIAGGAAGLIAPEVLSTPVAKIALSRAMNSPASAQAGRAIMTPAIQALINHFRQTSTGGQE